MTSKMGWLGKRPFVGVGVFKSNEYKIVYIWKVTNKCFMENLQANRMGDWVVPEISLSEKQTQKERDVNSPSKLPQGTKALV